jgi:hypothetical protein
MLAGVFSGVSLPSTTTTKKKGKRKKEKGKRKKEHLFPYSCYKNI